MLAVTTIIGVPSCIAMFWENVLDGHLNKYLPQNIWSAGKKGFLIIGFRGKSKTIKTGAPQSDNWCMCQRELFHTLTEKSIACFQNFLYTFGTLHCKKKRGVQSGGEHGPRTSAIESLSKLSTWMGDHRVLCCAPPIHHPWSGMLMLISSAKIDVDPWFVSLIVRRNLAFTLTPPWG